jgi:hypothetical protein
VSSWRRGKVEGSVPRAPSTSSRTKKGEGWKLCGAKMSVVSDVSIAMEKIEMKENARVNSEKERERRHRLLSS